MRRVLTTLLTGCTLLLAASPALAQTDPTPSGERVVAEVLPAVAYVETRSVGYVREKSTGRGIGTVSLTATCSGVVVSGDGHVATAGHCVDPEDVADSLRRRLAAEVVAQGTGTPTTVLAFILARYDVGGPTPGSPVERDVTVVRADGRGERLDATIVDSLPNERGDVALLDVDAVDLPTATLAPAGEITPGTPVTAVGYPADRDRVMDPSRAPSWKDGTVSSTQARDGVPFVEVSADMAPGMSGGPTVDARGRVIGLNSMGVGDSGAFNFLAPTATLRTMLERRGVRPEPGPVDTRYRAGLDALAVGENADAVTDLREVLRLRPDHARAAQQLTVAEQAYATVGDLSEDRARTRMIVAGSVLGVLLLAGAVVTTVLLVRRSRRRAFPTTGPIGPFPTAPAWHAGHPSGPFPTMPAAGPFPTNATGAFPTPAWPAGLPVDHPSGPVPTMPAAAPPASVGPEAGPVTASDVEER